MGPPGTSVHALLISDEASIGTGLFAITGSIPPAPSKCAEPSPKSETAEALTSNARSISIPLRVLNSSNSLVGFAGEFGRSEGEKGIAPRKLEKGGRDVEKQLGNLSVKPCR